jgi:hypothetical protein
VAAHLILQNQLSSTWRRQDEYPRDFNSDRDDHFNN